MLGCVQLTQYEIIAPQAIDGNFSVQGPNCEGLSTGVIELDEVMGGAAPYLFQLNDMPLQDSGLFQELYPGNYTYNVNDANGCSMTFNADLATHEIPVISLPDDFTVQLRARTTVITNINPILIEDISWSMTEFIGCIGCLEIELQPLNSAEYVLAVTSQGGCISRESVFITVEKEYVFYVPNIFSPNGDGQNDNYKVFKSVEVEQIDIFVFDRWET